MKLLVIGSSNTDMTVKTKKMPIPGETVLGGEFSINQGGKGANQAVSASKLGMETGYITCLGDDVFGKNALNYYEKIGLDISHIKIIKGISSGIALITVDERGENSIVVASGANNKLLPQDIINAKDYINSFDCILLQCEIPLETVTAAIKMGYELKKKIILNPAPAIEIPEKYYKMIDVILPNQYEARQLFGIDPKDKTLIYSELAHKLREKGIKNVVITLGTKGSFVSCGEEDFYVDCFKVKALDTTGAGDAFCASFAVAYLNGKSIKEACEFASKVSAVKVTRMGAQNSPTIQEVKEFNL